MPQSNLRDVSSVLHRVNWMPLIFQAVVKSRLRIVLLLVLLFPGRFPLSGEPRKAGRVAGSSSSIALLMSLTAVNTPTFPMIRLDEAGMASAWVATMVLMLVGSWEP